MTLGEKIQAIANSEYLRFVSNMNSYNIDPYIAVLILDNIKTKLLEQMVGQDLEQKVKTELEETPQ